MQMKLRWSLLLMVLSFAFIARSAAAQDDQDKDNYFTGTLVENASDHLKVSRVLQGKSEERVFKVNAQTKIEGGRLRLRQRVTVRYVAGDDSDTAILVIVRPAAQKNKK
ncbi:MAG: hypothetical protein LAO55_22055 [Acidobacteriia bacterium]|nr:hypothetical protein [Terriglobia bacterium]